jgi:putative lipoprotein (rSAM/lipoprotein system)
MKTIKKSFFRGFDKIIVLLLGSFGMFSACNDEMPLEYGMPHADFEIKGTVTNNTTSQPIQNIRVVRPHFPDVESECECTPRPGDTIYTDKNGQYAFAFRDSPGPNYRLKFEDVDGEDNGGLFETKEIEGKFIQNDQVKKGDGRWYNGKFVKIEDAALNRVLLPAPEYGVLATCFRP